MFEKRNVHVSSRIVCAAVLAFVTVATACQRAQKFQGVEIKVVDVQQMKQLGPQPGGIASVSAGPANKFVRVRLEIIWSGEQQELTLAQSDLELTDAEGKKYQGGVFPVSPSSGGKKTTTEEIAFVVPNNAQPKTFCIGKTCFTL